MKIETHNPYFKLIGVTINNIEFVYGEHNTGGNEGLEVYYKKPGETHHYYSRRFDHGKIPMIYNEAYINLKSQIDKCPIGSKLTLDINDYKTIAHENN